MADKIRKERFTTKAGDMSITMPKKKPVVKGTKKPAKKGKK